VFVDELVSLVGTSSTDADGDPLSFAWSFVSQPAGSTLGNVIDIIDYDGFGESDLYTVKVNSTEVFRQDYIHDDLGRITQSLETIEGVTTT
jgi:hypothetical protein